jgi:hypothetical protein
MQPTHRFFAERDQSFAIAFADDTQHTLIHVDLAGFQVHEL